MSRSYFHSCIQLLKNISVDRQIKGKTEMQTQIECVLLTYSIIKTKILISLFLLTILFFSFFIAVTCNEVLELNWREQPASYSSLLDKVPRCHTVSPEYSTKSPIFWTCSRQIPDHNITKGRNSKGTSEITEILIRMNGFSVDSRFYTYVTGTEALLPIN